MKILFCTAAIGLLLLLPSGQVLGQVQASIDLDAKFIPGQSQVWSPLFQASWDELNKLHEGKISKIDPPNEVMKKLDEFQWDVESVMPADSWAVYAGAASRDFITTVEANLSKEFGIDPAALNLQPSPSANLLVGALTRNLQFPLSFYRSQSKALEFTDGLDEQHQVAFFGSAGKISGNFESYARLLSYHPDSQSFLLNLKTKTAEEDLIVIHGMKGESFRSVIEGVRATLQNPSIPPKQQPLRELDVLKIPFVSFSSQTEFTHQLSGTRTYAEEPVPWTISSALQLTEFQLTERGAKVKVVTKMSEMPFGHAPEPEPQFTRKPVQLICDGPFILFAWRKDADWPYLAIRVDGGTEMETFQDNR